jgi:hypothetical protein
MIVEGGPHRGVAAPVVVAGAVILTFPFPLALTLAFAAIVGGWGVGGGGAIGGHDGSCGGGCGGYYCCGGCPTSNGVDVTPTFYKNKILST